MQHKAVFGMIEKHDLYNVVHDMIEQLMDLDIEQSIRMLTEKEETNSSVAMAKLKIPSNVVVAKLEHNSMYLYLVSISNYSCKKKKTISSFPVWFVGIKRKKFSDYFVNPLFPSDIKGL